MTRLRTRLEELEESLVELEASGGVGSATASKKSAKAPTRKKAKKSGTKPTATK